MRDDSYLDSGTATAETVRKWRSGAATAMGALISLTILTGVVVWSYRLGVRDADDIPVIRADSGLTKMRPEEPGGQVTPHQGRAVFDAVTGSGNDEAANAGLAPPPERLAAEDLAPAALSPSPPARPETGENADPSVAADLAAETAPDPVLLTETATDQTAPDEGEDPLAAAVAAAVAEVVGATGPDAATEQAPKYSPTVSPRPTRTAAAPADTAAAPEPRAEAAASAIQIQLGAFDSKEIAESQWAEIKSRNADFLGGRASVITSVQSGGRTLWRLRAGPFESVPEAAALCRGLEARRQACIVARAR